MIGANLIFAFNDVWMRRIADDAGLAQSLWGRSMLFLFLIVLTRTPRQWLGALRVSQPLVQCARATLPLLASFLLIGAMAYIPIADVAGLFFLAPLIAVLLAALVLGERIKAGIWFAVLLGLAGCLLIIRPGGGNFHFAHVLALAGAVSVAGYQIMTRLVAQRYRSDPRTTLLYMALTAAVITSCIMPFSGPMPDSGDWWRLLATGALYLIGHGIYILAHMRTEASRLSPFVYAQLAGSVGAAWFFFGQIPTLQTVSGLLIITAAGALPLVWRARDRAVLLSAP